MLVLQEGPISNPLLSYWVSFPLSAVIRGAPLLLRAHESQVFVRWWGVSVQCPGPQPLRMQAKTRPRKEEKENHNFAWLNDTVILHGLQVASFSSHLV